MAEALTVVGLGISLYQGMQSQKQQKQASREANQANQQQMALQQQQMERMNKQPQDQTDAVLAARDRQRTLAAAAYGRGDTVQTSPLGALGTAQTAGKNLIGA